MIAFVVVKVNTFFDKFIEVFKGFGIHWINAFFDRAVYTLDFGVFIRAMRMNEPMIDSRFGNDVMKFMTDKWAATIRLQARMKPCLLKGIIKCICHGGAGHLRAQPPVHDESGKDIQEQQEVKIPTPVPKIRQIGLPKLIGRGRLCVWIPCVITFTDDVKSDQITST